MVNTKELVTRFVEEFGPGSPTLLARAPGRVNLIGEHTDYNDGWVLPVAMEQALYVLGGRDEGTDIAVHSLAFGETIRFPAADPGPPGERGWSAYVRGVAALLTQRGIRLQPGRLLIHSEVPIGGGVSSSAALEVGTILALLGLASAKMDPIEIAMLARQAEHEYAGSPCGIMDQFICVLGKAGRALLLDCRSQAYEQVPMSLDAATLMVMDTQVKHDIGSSEYPVRQRQCREGLAVIRQSHPDAASLRDVTPEMLASCQAAMEEVTFRRCRHVVTEIARTEQAARALRAGDLLAFGKLMYASHASLRDDYEVSAVELDALVDLARDVPGVYGARMTGGGFGGCAIALVARDSAAELERAVSEQYAGRFERPALVYQTAVCDGASVLPMQDAKR
jgi:galactokinase